jgi:hypothetical protein
MSVPQFIYLLCAATSLVVAWLLLRSYRHRRTRLLFWSSIAFLCLAVNNVLVYADLVLFRYVDLSIVRSAAGMVGMFVLLFGLIWETEW